jgi:hypothetical protein
MPIDSPAEKKHKDCQHGKKKKIWNPAQTRGHAKARQGQWLIQF